MKNKIKQEEIKMCGIFGYVGKQQASQILIAGLKRLEYRGYDSAGVALVEVDRMQVIKESGTIERLERRFNPLKSNAKLGIAHTRWATHGVANKINAHPHIDCQGEIAVVHNGIIENYRELKEKLIAQGHIFKSDTDSEVIAHLIEATQAESLLERVRLVTHKLIGTYGLLVISSRDADQIVVARQGSPVMIGLGQAENFIASDMAAIIEHTQHRVMLEDRQLARITDKTTEQNLEIINFENYLVDTKVDKVQLSLAEIEKQGFAHFMLKEIFEQPKSLCDTMAGRVSLEKKEVKLGGISRDGYFEQLLAAQGVIMAACGTSWHAALVGEFLFENLALKPTEVKYASELGSVFYSDSLAFIISQSGETWDTYSALTKLQSQSITTFGICNVVGSNIARNCDAGVYIHAGPEIGVASTKAFTAQVLALEMIAIMLGKANGYLDNKFGADWMGKIIKNMVDLPNKIEAILAQADKIKELAEIFYRKRHFLFLGREINFPVALEGALKLKEISYIHAEGYPAGEMKHGPIALITKNMPVVVIIPQNDKEYNKIKTNIEEVKTRKGIVIAIATQGDEEINKLADYMIFVPRISYFLTPILNVVPLQLFAYYCAVLRGHNPDQPRNLAKSVTVQ